MDAPLDRSSSSGDCDVYVSALRGSDSNNGTAEDSPLQSLSAALQLVEWMQQHENKHGTALLDQILVCVEEGTYSGPGNSNLTATQYIAPPPTNLRLIPKM